MTITLDKLDARTLGALIALYERAVGFYATLTNVNAYDQPGVEAGKKAAANVLSLKKRAVEALGKSKRPMSVEQVAKTIDAEDEIETLHHLLEYLSANKRQVTGSKGKYKAV
jgi:glucose-6-phosphate isomerase